MAVVDFATSDLETCPKYQNWANFINKSMYNRIVNFTIVNAITTAMNPDPALMIISYLPVLTGTSTAISPPATCVVVFSLIPFRVWCPLKPA